MYIVFDIETTGVAPNKDTILEVGAIFLNESFEKLEEHNFTHQFDLTEASDVVPFVREMHTLNGLWDDCSTACLDLADTDFVLAGLAEKYAPGTKWILCGNSVHFDWCFVQLQMPEFCNRVSHRVIDISGVTRFFRLCGKTVEEAKVEMPHRALQDCQIEYENLLKLREYVSNLATQD